MLKESPSIHFPAVSPPSGHFLLPLTFLPPSPPPPPPPPPPPLGSSHSGATFSPASAFEMSWSPVMGSLPAIVLILTFCSMAENAAVRDDSRALRPRGAAQPVFVVGSDASNFFKRRGRRSGRYHAELLAEQREKSFASERWREHNEKRRNVYENYAEEQRNGEEHDLRAWAAEQTERSREMSEQIREYHYDGLYPRRYWFH
ncbi:putative cartilage matrix-associated protein [Takifugu flavidus]|uniref:Unique cartilage matrix-associated protein n=1 Tax=Takifugu flavidus TaxID=433684 RepID=A0A5C6NAF6_9TELE|nr:putative cartilage matrix-associated protein [Takifugu flavidus]